MHCPFCQHNDTRVIDSRVSEDGATIRRRRECEACGERFSTLETVELKLPAIIKNDGRREAFDARKLFAVAEEGKALIAERVARHGIDCDLKWGYLHAAPKARHVEELKEEQEVAERRFGYEGRLRLVDRDEVRRMVASPVYVGGLYDAGAGHLHPLNYCLGLATAAREAGARIFENSEVVRLETGRWRP